MFWSSPVPWAVSSPHERSGLQRPHCLTVPAGDRNFAAGSSETRNARKRAATLLFLARPSGDAWVVDHELVFVELDLGGEAPGPEADQPAA
jgi:hypothetical protein